LITKGTRVLITGACGSIGSSMVERMLSLSCVVCAFDQNEDGLFHLDQKYKCDYGDNLKLFIGSVRDKSRLDRALEGVEIVFHCAALKHVYLSEYNPFEAMLTNIHGVNNIINASLKANVRQVIFTSSDKAVNPSSTMGATKLLGERLITAANHHSGDHSTRFSSVRFGNVLNTNGSVLHIFKKQIKEGKPLTITSKNMTRFFITMDQAISLCLYAANNMIGGEVFVMNMGSCSIIDLAKAISQGESFEYTIIGEKPGEKLYEELVTEVEAPRTALKDNIYTVIPETLGMMLPSIEQKYLKTYKGADRLTESLRSDKELLTESEIFSYLKTNKIIKE
jgi:UDP-N-acetylglucosamine 4,6-dehydratase/5-epimerase